MSSKEKIIIGTRGSALARWQAEHVAQQLRQFHPDLIVELLIIKTQGDKILDVPLAQVGGKGLFVKEIEDALLRGEVDLAVHSMKDVPTELAGGLILSAISRRENPFDALVSRAGRLAQLPSGARVGTSSLRRSCQLRHKRPDLNLINLRGNVDTRLNKLDTGEFEAIVLACAGLVRLGKAARITEVLEPSVILPAVGQGALGIEIRAGDDEVGRLIRALHDEETAVCVQAERAVLRHLGGGCQVPIGAYAQLEGQAVKLTALVGAPDGTTIIKEQGRAEVAQALELSREIAARLLGRGGDKILASVGVRG